MKLNIKILTALLGLGTGFGLVATLTTPADTSGYSLIGGSLGLGQRDFRVYNNFVDAASNNNVTPHYNFPGTLGATMAFAKGVHEWGSEWRGGDGAGDVTQVAIGTGQANFDSSFQGETTSAGNNNANIISALSGSSGTVFAFMQGPISDGWTIKFYDGSWNWADGPGTIPNNQVDLQGVGCHEFGHALGLGHSGTGAATMFASTSPGAEGPRSIHSDDVQGVQAVYGVKVVDKPQITSLSGSFGLGQTLTIHGVNFGSDNVVWFTKINSDGVPTKVSGLPSTNGGTRIDVQIPGDAIDGDVLVKDADITGATSLSNSWPLDIDEGAGTDPAFLASINPTFGPAGGFDVVTLTGSGFAGATGVEFGGVPALDFSVDSPTQITATTPGGTQFAIVDVTVVDPEGSSTINSAYTYSFDPTPDISTVNPSAGPASGGTTVTISGASVVGVNSVTFGGVEGANLQVTSATTLTVDVPGGIGTVDVVATGAGSDTLTSAFTFTDVGGFLDVGVGIGGSLGVPTLTGQGDQTPGSDVGFEVTIGNTPDNAYGVWFWALGTGGATPFKQGTFYPLPILFSVGFVMPPPGEVTFPFVWDPAIPSGTQFTMQWWCQDATAPAGSGGSNGLRLDIP